MHLPPRRILRATTLSAVALVLAGCGQAAGTDGTGDGGPDVLASFYPLQYVAERIGGDGVSVAGLTPAGAEPHDLELSPVDVASIGASDLVVHLSGFQPAVDDALAQGAADHVLDVATSADLLPYGAHGEEDHDDEDHAGHDHDGLDTHFWLDPTRLADVGDAVAVALSEEDPDRASDYTANAAALRADLEALDADYAATLATCEQRVVVVSHEAFGYLTDRYDLEQVGVSGVDPESEPSPARLEEIRRIVEHEGVTTIFTETLASPKVAQVLADDLGVDVATLDPVEGLVDERGDYLSVMRANLDALAGALSCA